MILNNKQNAFAIWFNKGWVYPEVVEKWYPIVKRLQLPYMSVEDFLNNNIQSITFPSVAMPAAQQGQSQFMIDYRNGKELEPLTEKTLNIQFKLTESYLTYWIIYDQIQLFLAYGDVQKTYWEPIHLTFLDNNNLGLLTFHFKYITPIGLGELNLSYAATIASYTNFTLTLTYNRFTVEPFNNKQTTLHYEQK